MSRPDSGGYFGKPAVRGGTQEGLGLFGLNRKAVLSPREPGPRDALRVRNAVIHAMDIDLGAPNRHRRQRKKSKTTEQVRILLETAKAFLEAADRRLQDR